VPDEKKDKPKTYQEFLAQQGISEELADKMLEKPPSKEELEAVEEEEESDAQAIDPAALDKAYEDFWAQSSFAEQRKRAGRVSSEG